MRIFCAVRHANDPKNYYGGLWSGNFYPALRRLGHEIVESRTDLLRTSRFMHVGSRFTPRELEARAQTTEQILNEVRAEHRVAPVHLFLSYFYNAHFEPAGFDELRQIGIPSVNFYCNSIYQFDLVAAIAAEADFSWYTERGAWDLYRSLGSNPVWVQMGADPDVCRSVTGPARQAKACFIGQRYADRDRWIAALLRAEVPLDIYGSGWSAPNTTVRPRPLPHEDVYLERKHHRPGSAASYADALRETFAREGLLGGIARLGKQRRYRRETRELSPLIAANARGWVEDIGKTFAAYEVCLNFSNVWADGRPGSPLIPHVRLRDFEAPMCRTCYLTGHTDEIMAFYEVGHEIDTYRTPAELVDKARFYLAHPALAEKLREAGYRRALRDHTWVQRFRELFQKIGMGDVR
jgi:spore maturation protein CgeB